MTSAEARGRGRRALQGPGSSFHADGSGSKGAGGGRQRTKREYDTLGELALRGFFRGFQKTAGPRYILFIYRADVVAALCTEGSGSGVDMTQMFSEMHTGVSVSPLLPGWKGATGPDGIPDPGRQQRIWECLSPVAQLELPREPWPPAQPTLRAWPTDALPPAPQMGEKTTRCIQSPELSRAKPPPRHPALTHQPSVPLSGGTVSPRLPRSPRTPLGRGLGAASRALAAPGQSSSFIILCRPGPAVAVCNREAGRERKFLKSASARTENTCPGGKRVPRGVRGSRRA